jgi:hypothetical protein
MARRFRHKKKSGKKGSIIVAGMGRVSCRNLYQAEISGMNYAELCWNF